MQNTEPIFDLEEIAIWCILFVLLCFSLGACAPVQKHIAHQRDLQAQYQENQRRYAAERHALQAQQAALKTTTKHH